MDFKIVPCVIGTMNGLKLDDHFQVLNKSGEAIPNLYAAGEVAMGNFFFREYVATSSAVARAVYGGTLVADDAIAAIDAK